MLKHKNLRNIAVATSYGKIHFDEFGYSDDLTEEEQKELGKLHNFSYVTGVEEEEEDTVEEETTEEEESNEEVESNEEEESNEEVEESNEEEEESNEDVEVKDYKDITATDIKKELDRAGVEYGSSDPKKVLYELYVEEYSK